MVCVDVGTVSQTVHHCAAIILVCHCVIDCSQVTLLTLEADRLHWIFDELA